MVPPPAGSGRPLRVRGSTCRSRISPTRPTITAGALRRGSRRQPHVRRHRRCARSRRRARSSSAFMRLRRGRRDRRTLASALGDRRRSLVAARSAGVGAPRVKGTAGWKVAGLGGSAADRRERPLPGFSRMRECVEQGPGVRVSRVLEHCSSRAALHDATGVKDRQPVRDRGHHAEIVRDEDDRRDRARAEAGRAAAGSRPGRSRRARWSARRRSGASAARKRDRDRDALAHAAGELVRIAPAAPVSDRGSEPRRATRAARARPPRFRGRGESACGRSAATRR